MMPAEISRRRFIRIAASAVGVAALSGPSTARMRPYGWTGTAMGADAGITLYHHDPAQVQPALAAAVREIQLVESWFSLFRRDSLLVQLNQTGRVDQAPAAFRALVQQAGHYAALSNGAFDVTVQPLWDLYARHFAQAGADGNGPSAAAIRAAAARVGWQDLRVQGEDVVFARPGMAATFNGIAQGYVTDRVADLLRQRGFDNVLLDLGEFRAMGAHDDGRPWRVGIADPLAPDQILRNVALTGAMATSGGYGTCFDRDGRFHHLFDPATGRCWSRWAGVTVMAATATAADALTKAVALAEPAQAQDILRAGGGTAALLVAPDGKVKTLRT